jgi:hypothetical protein
MEAKDFKAWFDLNDNSSSNSGNAIEKNTVWRLWQESLNFLAA